MARYGFGLLWLLAFFALALSQEPGVTVKTEPFPVPGQVRKALRRSPGPVPALKEPAALAPDSGWNLVDSFCAHWSIPAGEKAVIAFDRAGECLRDTLRVEHLSALSRQAVAIAPSWLQDDLADNLRRIGTHQDRYADLIVNCPDKRYYDELCFQVAHLSPTVLSRLQASILVDNVQLAYEIDPELSYVDIIDYGDPLPGGDYYSTTEYRAIVAGDTVLVEIPREVYYWWVISPKVTDEEVKYVYGYFWREYLFYHCDSGYPLLWEKLGPVSVLWNGERQNWTNRGQGYPDTLPAVAVVSRWVAHTLPYSAQGNRPIQPNQIAHEHDGNCGEVQDLLCAAARTALIPCGGVMDINEDHVWDEIWWQDEFHPWQVDLGGGATNIKNPGVAYDRRHGGGKQVSGVWDWRNDGWQRSVAGTYSYVCTLTVEVRDSLHRTVDGAILKLSSEFWYGGLIDCFYGVTDRNGRYTTTLGDLQNYYLSVTSPLGLLSCGRIIDSVDCLPDAHFFYACTLSGRLDSLEAMPDSGVPLELFRIDVSFTVDHEALYGHDCYNEGGANQYALMKSPGAIDFFIADSADFANYESGQAFQAFALEENASAANQSLVLPEDCDYYAVLSNEEQANLTAFVDIVVRLYKRGTAVGELTSPGIRPRLIGPNPSRSRFVLELGDKGQEKVVILDPAGRVVRVIEPVENKATWDGKDDRGAWLGPGVYFCRAGHDGPVLPLVWLGR